MPQLLFRPADAGDLDAVLALYRGAVGRPFCVWNDLYPGKEEADEDLATGNLYVLAENGRPVGAISIVPQNELDDCPGWSPARNPHEIARVVIAPSHQGRGLAARMVGEIIEVLRTRGCDMLRLSVARSNLPACKTYEKAGCVKVSEAELYGGAYHLMEKPL